MMVGKRVRNPMKRTTSMTEFSFDDLTIINPGPSDHQHQLPPLQDRDRKNYNQRTMMAMVSPRPMHRRNSADFALRSTTIPRTFLNTCSLCNRAFPPGRDIYMYRGDSGFCSQECREEQMAEDERKEKEKNKFGVQSQVVKESKSNQGRGSHHIHSHSHSHSSSSSPAGSSHVSSANS